MAFDRIHGTIFTMKTTRLDAPLDGQTLRIRTMIGGKGFFSAWKISLRRYKWLYILIIPSLAYYLVFHYYPLYGVTLAFKDFKPIRSTLGSHVLRGPLISPTAKNLFVERPVPRPDRCTLCYQCRVICPAGAISRADEKGKTPVYDYRKCIRCLCCLEVCPEAAIRLEQGRLQWVLQLNERLLGAR